MSVFLSLTPPIKICREVKSIDRMRMNGLRLEDYPLDYVSNKLK